MSKTIDMKQVRMEMWLDKIIVNLSRIEQDIEATFLDCAELRKQLREQYRLVTLLRDTAHGRTILKGMSTTDK